MNLSAQPQQNLVLIGGGHSHAIVLKKLGMNPPLGCRLTLITDVMHTPYSGMLPGYVAGLYDYDDCHIDLRPLSQFAQARLVVSRATGLDLERRQVHCADRPPIPFDILSIDIGSTPTVTVPGAADYAIPAKPISHFLAQWDQLVEQVMQQPQQPLRIGIVGGGAGGVELALAVQARLQHIYRAARQPTSQLEMHLFHRGSTLLPQRQAWLGKCLQHILRQRQIQLHLQQQVVEVQPGLVVCESGLTVACDRIFWVTQASATPWLAASGLATDARGFVQVRETLQSVSHLQVFAAGDVATMVNHPRPKAGVFAVRQGQPLANNLRRMAQQQALQPFVPQQEFLILIGTGVETAIASRGAFGLGPYGWIWRWKDAIDRRFMTQFTDLQPMAMADEQTVARPGPAGATATVMRCAGCGSKVGNTILSKALQRVQQDYPLQQPRADILIGLDAPDDAAVMRIPQGQVMVQTVDYFRALVNDPFIFGQISTNHCLSDLFAMGAMPQSALAIATLPYGLPSQQEETLYQLLAGATRMLHQVQAPLVGGHTTEGAELAFGLTCNGLADPNHLLRKSGMQPGQVLILTKPLGTGVLFAADMRLQAKGRWIEAAIATMLLSNFEAAHCLRQHKASACTDITGFGLLGHLLEMVRASQVGAELYLDSIPVLDGVIDLGQQGIVSSLYGENEAAAIAIPNLAQVRAHPLYGVLFDPQTSGGLLAAIPADYATACLATLHALGYRHSQIVGQVRPLTDQLPLINLKPTTIKQ